ncbi:hypothetical protein APHAL10511_008580, partial [Amanita phalloides]
EVIDLSSDDSLGTKLEQVEMDQKSLTPSLVPPPAKKLKGQAMLDVPQLKDTSRKNKEESKKAFQMKVNHIIMHLICIRGLIPNVIDSPEWKELMEILNPSYHPTSSSMFSHDIIPKEAAYVHSKQIELLMAVKIHSKHCK